MELKEKSADLKLQYEIERKRIAEFSDDAGDYFNPVFGNGNLNAEAMLIGEAPGKDEVLCGKAFVGMAGKQLNALFESVNIDREQFFVTNAVKYRPWTKSVTKKGLESIKNRTPLKSELISSAELLKREIELIKPKVVVTLGNSPLFSAQYILNTDKLLKIGECHGEAVETDMGFVLFPLYHPASCIYNRSLLDVLKADIKKLSDYIN